MPAVKIVGDPLPNIPWQPAPEGGDSPVWRHRAGPLIGWNPTPSTARVFNSAVVAHDGAFAGVFRADHRDGRPALHVGRSADGLSWELEDEPIRWVDEDGRPYKPTYAYDPRVVFVEDAYYIIWCTDFGGASLALGRTHDFRTFVRLENITTPYNRNGVLFPRRINGRYVVLTRPSDNTHTRFGDIYLSQSPDLVHWGRHRKVMSVNDPRWWQCVKIGAGAAPIETSEGWLVLYHGVNEPCNGLVYSMGAALLDLENPAKVLYRTRDYLLTPQEPYETTGFVPNVVFPCASLQDPETGRLAIYYGAADTYVAVAYAQIDDLVAHIKANSELVDGDGEVVR
ncbi:glycoside hydrolase family 130 protein [Saccharothrix sp. S26]|uniref:glycoside hydrolase family 130 protein n=1 Tax=Saccharothrix sp. S26 TaxID=2907215 RepID=UPI001F1E9BCE|nr:glycoside hydrolase family 130 protein [Saccharothrix sp. S26]MCE6995229.1 glycoside hydrolase family 130 protein [Saccharothrix sp. S26]